MEQKPNRAQIFRQKYGEKQLITITTTDGLEWVMSKPSAKFFFDLFIKRDISIGALSIDTEGEEVTPKDPDEVLNDAKKILPIYELMKDTLIKFSESPKIVDSGIEPGEDEISLDDFPSFEYLTELFNKLTEGAGVPIQEVKQHESFRE